MRRTDLMDTSEWAHKEMVRRLQELTLAEKYRITLDLLDQISPEAKERMERELLEQFTKKCQS